MRAEKKKNVIWFLSDQFRSQAVGCHGDPNAVTPHIDLLASSGVDFTNAVSGFPLCCPFRGSLMTGLYPHNNGVLGHEYPLVSAHPTIADEFNRVGYDTAYFGKWHLDGFKEAEGRAAWHIVPSERRGRFKTWIGYENNDSPYDSWVHGHRGEEEIPLHRLPGYETDELTSLGIEYINGKKESNTPFFMVISVQPPHNPYIAPAEFARNYKPESIRLRRNVPRASKYETAARKMLAGYYGMVENLDWNVGRLVDCLRKTNLMEDTHFMFFSDHGDMLGSHGQCNKTRPHEEAIRIPFIISGESPFDYEGRKCTDTAALLNHVDIAPTTLGLCGIDIPDYMEGYDYSSKRIDKPSPDKEEPDSVFLQQVAPSGNPNSVDKKWRGIVTKSGWKYACFEGMPWVLFNLHDDPYEQVNLAHNSLYYPQQKELLGQLREWIEKTGDSFNLPIL